jgi:hypothetical protein
MVGASVGDHRQFRVLEARYAVKAIEEDAVAPYGIDPDNGSIRNGAYGCMDNADRVPGIPGYV